MPVEGMQYPLENMLKTLLQEKSLSSFKIEGWVSKTVLILRILTSTGQSSAMPAHTATFRHNRPSQVNRDRERTEAHEVKSTKDMHVASYHRPLFFFFFFLSTPPSWCYDVANLSSKPQPCLHIADNTPCCKSDTARQSKGNCAGVSIR